MKQTANHAHTRKQPEPSEPRPPTRWPQAGDQLRLDRRSVIRFVLAVVVIGIALLTIPVVAGLPAEPFLLVLVYGLYLGGAVLTARRAGPGGVRRLFSGVLHWRIGWGNWAFAVASIPLATVAVALVAGNFIAPSDGWALTFGNYLFLTFIFGALIINIFEETAWQGLVQRNLTRDYGPLRAAALTAVPFALVHIPLSFIGDVTTGEALVALGIVFIFAPAMRYLMGRLDISSGGSLLAVGVMHASLNASEQIGLTSGGWEHIAGLAIVALVTLAADSLRRQSRQAPVGDAAAVSF